MLFEESVCYNQCNLLAKLCCLWPTLFCTARPKLTGRGECNADDHDIYYCGQESHRKNGVVYAPTSYAKEAEVEWFYEDIQDLLELTLKKVVLFIIGNLDAL